VGTRVPSRDRWSTVRLAILSVIVIAGGLVDAAKTALEPSTVRVWLRGQAS
jgi:hypothetical protein